MQIKIKMFDLVISRHIITRDFIILDLTCIAAPPIRLVLSAHCGGYESYGKAN